MRACPVLVASRLAGGVLLALVAAPLAAEDSYPPLQSLLSASTDVLGAPIAWPEGEAQLNAAIVTMRPGQNTGLHRHPGPMFAWVLEGEITVTYRDDAGTVRTYRKGEALIEAQEVAHSGVNTGAGPLRLLVVIPGAKGLAATVSLPE
ncbi:cupin domain-containing protein [uncultured Albimonas sp.]|uniref:cupin domain-containing protein n=1 Tax=uncultured Albimonas sp. TaxID=1331701 RepID=UPI0030EEC798|tara:strand:- start:360 stop:803 length:444 start_codon:yes stop_codon:yes gene_type:complete